ncbi:MAG TPA: Uma2 family endonuclease [Pirellulales bacterium]|jgi:Uma2 family endonuclease|nr:Uma2 family endonuclease [Pirellulales bacterium]
MATLEQAAALQPPKLLSVEEYLAAELASPVKREYVGGAVYMMARARIVHNVVAGNIFGFLHYRLRGKRCQPFNSDTKVHIALPTQARFYYPDVQVVCRSNPANDTYQDEPTAVVEVLSRSTRRIDQGEKKDAYLTIPSLAVYLLVEIESPAVTAYRRTEQGFVREVRRGLETVVQLPEIEAILPLAEVYERVVFAPEPADSE